MRIVVMLIWAVACFYFWYILKYRFNLQKYETIFLGILTFIIFLFSSKVLTVEVTSYENRQKINQILSEYGDSYVRVEGDSVFVLVNGSWVNLKDIELIGGLLGDELTIRYDGKTVYLGNSGVVNVLKTLHSLGLI